MGMAILKRAMFTNNTVRTRNAGATAAVSLKHVDRFSRQGKSFRVQGRLDYWQNPKSALAALFLSAGLHPTIA